MLCWFRVIFLVLIFTLSTAWAAPNVGAAMDRAGQIEDEIKRETAEVFDKANALSNSPQFLEGINREATRALQNVDTMPVPALPNFPALNRDQLKRARSEIGQLLDQAQGQQGATTTMGQKSGPQLYLFVSFSMPEITLKRLLSQANRIDGSLILRGLVDGSLGKTKEKISLLLEADAMGITQIKGGLAIDPTLFERFDISQVPSFVLTNRPAERCNEAGCPSTDYARLSGDTTIEYALETMAREAPALKASAQILLARMKGGSND